MTSQEIDRSILESLDKSALKLILKTSQGFASPTSKAKIKGPIGSKYVSPSRTGHAMSRHVRGVTATSIKTKFCRVDDMASALDLLLKTPVGQQTLAMFAADLRNSPSVKFVAIVRDRSHQRSQ